MRYFLVTGHVAATEYQPATPDSPERQAVPAHDISFQIGESNPFDASGKPFKTTFHKDLGVSEIAHWKSLLTIFGTRITHEFVLTPEGLRQPSLPGQTPNEITPAFHLMALMNDGYMKDVQGEKIIFWKQKGRIEDESGKTYTAQEMIKILEEK